MPVRGSSHVDAGWLTELGHVLDDAGQGGRPVMPYAERGRTSYI